MELNEIRELIDSTDNLIIPLVVARLRLALAASEAKKKQGIPYRDKEREQDIIKKVTELADEGYGDYISELYETLFLLSRKICNEEK